MCHASIRWPMVVIDAYRTGLATIRRNPVLVAAALLVGLVGALPSLAQRVNYWLGLAIQPVFYLILPFLLAGLFGMANQALGDRTDFGRFVAAGRAYYLRMLGAGAIVFVVLLIGGFIAGLVGVFAAIGLAANGGVPASAVAWLPVVLVVLLVTLVVYVLPMYLFQFVPLAIVVEDAGVVGSLSRSVRLSVGHAVPTLGFDALATALFVLVNVPTAWLFASNRQALAPSDTSINAEPFFEVVSATDMAVWLLSVLVLGTLATAVIYTAQTAFFRRITDADAEPEAA
jgi:hypothetical protein